MRPALVMIAAAIALFLLAKGLPYLVVRAEALATSIVFSRAWDHARGGLDAAAPDRGRPQAGDAGDPGWQLTAAHPVARLTAPRLGSRAVIVNAHQRAAGGIVDFLLVAPALSGRTGMVPPPDAVRGGDGGAPQRLTLPGEALLADGSAGTIHAHGVADTVIVDAAGRSLRFLPDLRPGDDLELEGVDGHIYRYKVTGSRVALTLEADELINADLIDGRPELTLVAPYPLNDLTPSNFRYVVRANFIDLADR